MSFNIPSVHSSISIYDWSSHIWTHQGLIVDLYLMLQYNVKTFVLPRKTSLWDLFTNLWRIYNLWLIWSCGPVSMRGHQDECHIERSVLVKRFWVHYLIANFMGQTWGPHGVGRTQVVPMLATWNLLSGLLLLCYWSVGGMAEACVSNDCLVFIHRQLKDQQIYWKQTFKWFPFSNQIKPFIQTTKRKLDLTCC